MRPLGTRKYFKENKKSLVTSLIVISLSITLIYGLSTFLSSMEATNFTSSKELLDKAIYIYSAGNPIKDQDREKIKSIDNVNKIISYTISQKINFATVGNNISNDIYGLSNEDSNYIIDKYNIKIKEGRIPKEKEKAIALNYKVALNSNLKIGDYYEENKIVGILESDVYFSMKPLFSEGEEEYNPEENLLLIFPEEEAYNDVEEEIKEICEKENYKYTSMNTLKESFYESTTTMYQIFDSLTIFIIVVNVIILACTKYSQFLNRKDEYGILSAIGYSKKEIMIRAFNEIIIINIMATILGFIIAYLVNKVLLKFAFMDMGGIAIYFSGKGIVLALLVPIFTTIFTLIPIYRTLNKMDSITIIEEE